MESKKSAERYIVSAENRNYKQLTAEIADCYGIKPPSVYAGPLMMGIAWRAAAIVAAVTGKHPAIDKVSAQAASVTRDYDNAKLKKATGIVFKPVSDTIKEICVTP
jgi:hypothetical protein